MAAHRQVHSFSLFVVVVLFLLCLYASLPVVSARGGSLGVLAPIENERVPVAVNNSVFVFRRRSNVSVQPLFISVNKTGLVDKVNNKCTGC